MKQKLSKWLSALLALCLLVAVVAPAFAADNGTAYDLSLTIDNEFPTLGDSVTVSASFAVDGTDTSSIPDGCTLSIWYQNDSDWVTPVNGSSSTTSTTLSLDSSYFTDGTSYTVYAELYDSSWTSLASASVTFTVDGDNTSGSSTPTYGLSLSASDSAPALGDSVTISASFTVDGTAQSTIPDGCTLSIWYQNDNDWVTPVNASTDTTSASISLSSANFTDGSTYTIYAELYDSNWTVLASDNVSITVDGNNTSGSTDTYAVTITPSATECEQNETITFTAVVTKNGEEIDLSEQSDIYLWIWADSWADGHSDGLTDCSISPNTGLANSVTIEFPSVGTYYIAYTLEDSSYSTIDKSTDVAAITVTESTATPSEDITTGSLSCDFMRGMDLSTFYTNWTNGAVYYDYDGNEYSQAKGNAMAFFQFLYDECGVNWVRLRVWNDPYDSDGNPYGGGNNDVATAAIIGKWASDAGMTVLIDFHYSDFWADPGRQLAPKAWTDMTIDEKVEALYTYTYDSLETLLDAGVNVGMVQVGNETNGTLCGEAIDWSVSFDASTNETWQNICALFSSGSQAVRDISDEYGTTIKVALHFTNPNANNPSWYAGLLADAGVDYDAMGISYYMYWHGTLSNLQSEIETIASTYGKEVFIAETAYPYTSENYDNCGNQVTSYDDFDMNANLYAISEAGQEAALTAILDTAATAEGCTGMFYWEAAWTALPGTYDEGTGWATKWASDYISYSMSASEGTSFDNQTLFDNNGNALAALKYYVDYAGGTANLPEHDYQLDVAASSDATCTTDGENVYVCSVCGDSYTEVVSATGHTEGEAVIENEVAATCTTDGSYDSVIYCSVCGEELSRETVTVAATGHTEGEAVTENEVAATCTESGSYDTAVYCTVCGALISREKTILTALGVHSWDEGVVTKEATADEDGEITYTCTVCGETYTVAIAALGEDEDDSSSSSSSSSSESSSSSSSSESSSSSAKTGDNASLILWVVLAGVALVVLGAILLTKRRFGHK